MVYNYIPDKYMSQIIVTIGREYGSGGREIGEKLAEKLKVPIYDKEIITESVKRSGFCQEIFETYDEHSTPSLLYSLAMGSFVIDQQISLPDQIFLEQFKTIRNLADKGSCIFIGRCADYVLEEKDNLISIFIKGNEEDKIARIMERNNLSEEEAIKKMNKIDKARKSYYERYTCKKWGDTNSYDVTLNSSTFGIDRIVEFLFNMIKEMK